MADRYPRARALIRVGVPAMVRGSCSSSEQLARQPESHAAGATRRCGRLPSPAADELDLLRDRGNLAELVVLR